MTIPTPVFVGYFPLRPVAPPSALDLPGVELICSVSHCMVDVPEDWIQQWKHNELGFFDTLALAEQVAGSVEGSFEFFAYRVFPIQIHDSSVEDFVVPVSPSEELAGFTLIGFDVVTRYAGTFFECSPLSCNGGAKEFNANQHCLFDSAEIALDAAVKMESADYEPGPYHVIEVWRRHA